MTEVLLFAILGLATGAAYALTGIGIVLTYNGSGVVNFAQGALLMLAAFTFAGLAQDGMSAGIAAIVVIAAAGVVGALIYLLVMRPLRSGPQLAKVIATIGILVAAEGGASLLWGNVDGALAGPQLLPTQSVNVFGVAFGVNQIYILAVTGFLVTILWAIYRFTRFGLATRATAENERGASFLGFSPDFVATVNWALGSILAAIAGVLLASVAVLDISSLTLLVLPALAAAMIGRFKSFGVTAVVGIAIGVGQSELTEYWNVQGILTALPFVVVVLAMVVTGRLIPPRGLPGDQRQPFAMSGRVRLCWVVILPGAVVLLLTVLSRQYQGALTTSMIIAIIALSLTVVTGYVGQVNLAPMTFAGFGAFAAAKFGYNLGVPFPLPIIFGAMVAIPIGVIIGIPALRVRGINLAVVTLGAAIAIDAVLFQNKSLTGGSTGSPVPNPHLWSFSLEPAKHAARFGFFVLVCLCLVMLAVSALRTNPLGRRMLAVRNNERAAAAAGISVPVVKVQAFAISAAIAAIGGGVLAYQLSSVSYIDFSPFQSLTLVTLAYIGGIASVSGALQAGLIATGGLFYVLFSQIGALDNYWTLLGGILLVITIVTQPDGIAVVNSRLLAAVTGRRRQPPVVEVAPNTAPPPEPASSGARTA
jgi:branched-chain amino acid transport system permease protein